MDPNTCYSEYIFAMNTGNVSTAKEKRRELLEWLSRGGFEPDWTPADKEWFMVQRFKGLINLH